MNPCGARISERFFVTVQNFVNETLKEKLGCSGECVAQFGIHGVSGDVALPCIQTDDRLALSAGFLFAKGYHLSVMTLSAYGRMDAEGMDHGHLFRSGKDLPRNEIVFRQLDAIEVYNAETGYSPEAHEWCLKHNLAIIGASDSHAPFFTKIDYMGGQHRVVTLVFAKERSQDGLREAMDDRRTAIFAEGMVYGREKELTQLFHGCVQVKNVKFSPKQVRFTLENNSSIPVRLSKAPGSEKYMYSRYIDLPPHSTVTMAARLISTGNKTVQLDESIKEMDLNFFVETFHIGADKPLPATIKLKW